MIKKDKVNFNRWNLEEFKGIFYCHEQMRHGIKINQVEELNTVWLGYH